LPQQLVSQNFDSLVQNYFTTLFYITSYNSFAHAIGLLSICLMNKLGWVEVMFSVGHNPGNVPLPIKTVDYIIYTINKLLNEGLHNKSINVSKLSLHSFLSV